MVLPEGQRSLLSQVMPLLRHTSGQHFEGTFLPSAESIEIYCARDMKDGTISTPLASLYEKGDPRVRMLLFSIRRLLLLACR
jgi:hypothetical protein